jgi:recombination protein RecA
MASLAVIRAQVESRLPGALTVYERTATEVFPTGIAALDKQIGGIPQGALTQICAAPGMSSDRTSVGKTSLLVSLIAQMTRREQFCALVDASDCFDPASAEPAGVNLSRLLWVRCAGRRKLPPLEQAFKAADILVQNGGFGLIAVDLGNVPEKLVRKVPLTTWFRFARVVEKMPAALVFLAPYPAAQSCAGLTLHLACAEPHWSNPKNPDAQEISHAQFLAEVRCEVEIGRSRLRKPSQSANGARFTATPRWA